MKSYELDKVDGIVEHTVSRVLKLYDGFLSQGVAEFDARTKAFEEGLEFYYGETKKNLTIDLAESHGNAGGSE